MCPHSLKVTAIRLPTLYIRYFTLNFTEIFFYNYLVRYSKTAYVVT